MRFRLRTLMILLTVGPAVLAGLWFVAVALASEEWKPARGEILGCAVVAAAVLLAVTVSAVIR